MDPVTWKKEGISSVWSGARGLRKSCCKVCCSDTQCGGCRECLCRQGPVRGLYDGLVILTCLTRQSVPRDCLAKIDHEELAVALEHSLTVHCMQADSGLGGTVVHTGRDKFIPEHNYKLGKPKKHAAYCLYLAYRLDSFTELVDSRASSFTHGSGIEEDDADIEDEDTVQVMEELEDKQLITRLASLEQVTMTIYQTFDYGA